MASKVAIAVLALMVVLMGAPSAVTGAISCGQVVKSLVPCMPYLRNGGPVPPPCCNGVRSLNRAAATTPDRQAACRCLKAASAGVNLGNAGTLPGKCGVNIGYPISPSVNCDTVK